MEKSEPTLRELYEWWDNKNLVKCEVTFTDLGYFLHEYDQKQNPPKLELGKIYEKDGEKYLCCCVNSVLHNPRLANLNTGLFYEGNSRQCDFSELPEGFTEVE